MYTYYRNSVQASVDIPADPGVGRAGVLGGELPRCVKPMSLLLLSIPAAATANARLLDGDVGGCDRGSNRGGHRGGGEIKVEHSSFDTPGELSAQLACATYEDEDVPGANIEPMAAPLVN